MLYTARNEAGPTYVSRKESSQSSQLDKTVPGVYLITVLINEKEYY